jgi:multidrug efflux pump subunit AcrB
MFLDILLIIIFISGIYSMLNSRKEGFPELSLNKIIIKTIYPGASSKDVELNVTIKIEDKIKEIENIKEIISHSEEGISRIEVQGIESMDAVAFRRFYSDLENAVDQIDDLPSSIKGKPIVSEIKTSDVPILEIAFTGNYSSIKPYLESLKLKLNKLNGVSNVDLIGLPDEEIQIIIDSEKAKKYSLDLRSIVKSIKQRNVEGSGGLISTIQGEKKVIFDSKFESIEDILKTELIANEVGNNTKLQDIATLSILPEDIKLIVRNNGERGAILSINKTENSDLLNTVDGILKLLNTEFIPKDINYRILFDQSILTRDRIKLLIGNSIMGFLLVILILLYFLNWETAVWTALGIPFTLMGMLIFLKSMDISLNLISLGGFIIIIGMLVDDAVVIAEEYNSNRELGFEPLESAEKAVGRMWSPVLASSATTMVAFAPLFIVGGFPGAFIWTIPLMVIVGLTISLVESYLSLPIHLAGSKTRIKKQSKSMLWLESNYRTLLSKTLDNRYRVLFSLIILLFLSVIVFAKFIKKDPFPQDAAEVFSISLTLPLGLSAVQSEQVLNELEKILLRLPKEELIGISTRIGTQSALSYTDRGIQNNLAIIFIYLTPYQNRDRNANQIMLDLESRLAIYSQKNPIQFSFNLRRIGPPMGRDLEVRLKSNDDRLRNEKITEINNYLKSIEGVTNIDVDKRQGLEEISIVLNYSLLAITGLTVDDILNSAKIALNGLIVTDIIQNDKKINYRLKLKEKTYGNGNKPDKLEIISSSNSLPIVNRQGNSIKMESLVSFKNQSATATIHHIDHVRSNTIFANINSQIISPNQVMDLIKTKFQNNKSVEISYSGQPVETDLIFSGLSGAALLALLGIYFIIALIFNSYTRPFIIIFALPFMMIGLAFVLFTHNLPGSMMVGIAVVGLMGVVVNAGIVLVDTIYELGKEKNLEIDKELTIEGSTSRLRPIILTSLTTILGVLPTGYGVGGLDPFLSHMSLVLAYGLLFSTIIILFLIPIFILIGKDIRRKMKKISIKPNLLLSKNFH